MQETFKVASSDDKIMMRTKERERKLHRKKMAKLFKAADASGDGKLDISEFRSILLSDEVKTWLAAQELSVRDADKLFSLLDDGDSSLTSDELVRGVERLKGPAKAMDMAGLMNENQLMHANLIKLMNSMDVPEIVPDKVLE